MSTRQPSVQRLAALGLGLIALGSLSACGTLTGIPAHGGGKRFATEQRLVSASIRAALKDIDVTPLKGKRAALIFDLVADEGGGSFNGGRWSPGLLFSVGSVASPVTTTTNAFQVYNLAEVGTNYSNSSSGGGSVTVSTTQQSGSSTNTGTSNTDGSSTNTSTGSSTGTSNTTGSNTSTGSNTNTSTTTNSGTSTTTGSGTNTGTTTNSGTSSGTSSSSTGGTTTNSSFNQSDSSSSATNGSSTNTSTTNSSGSSTTTGSGTNNSSGTNTSSTNSSGTNTSSGSGTNTSATSSSGSGTNASTATTTTTSSNTGTNRSSGGNSNQRETISPTPTETRTVTEGTRREHTATLQYRGLGEYQNFPVPKSDASLLMGLVRNYMIHSGVVPTTPNDPTAEVLVYVTVDIFGTVRSRFDALLYNNETVKAETSFEISAFDKDGKRILSTQVANREAKYQEHYLLWAGPLTTQERVYQGQGLLVDFTDVDGSKRSYNPSEPVVREHLGGKN